MQLCRVAKLREPLMAQPYARSTSGSTVEVGENQRIKQIELHDDWSLTVTGEEFTLLVAPANVVWVALLPASPLLVSSSSAAPPPTPTSTLPSAPGDGQKSAADPGSDKADPGPKVAQAGSAPQVEPAPPVEPLREKPSPATKKQGKK